LELNYAEKELVVTVQDNGIGFDPELALAKAGHWGFRGMRERARQIGGTFAVENARGGGSKITVAAPWKN
jgi:signal transduction histidine kinase